MKLKKFAALALAGMMAVSMLAACSDKTTTGEEEDNQIVATSDAVTYANDALSASMKEHATFKANPTLDGWVKDIATNTDNLSATNIKTAYNTYTSVNLDKTNVGQTNLRTKLEEKLKDSNVIYVDQNKDCFDAVPDDKDAQSTSWVYVLSGVLDEKSAVQMAVERVVDNVNFPSSISGNKYTCEYSPEISALRVTNESLTGESAWVVAIVVTQTVTEAANVEA